MRVNDITSRANKFLMSFSNLLLVVSIIAISEEKCRTPPPFRYIF